MSCPPLLRLHPLRTRVSSRSVTHFLTYSLSVMRIIFSSTRALSHTVTTISSSNNPLPGAPKLVKEGSLKPGVTSRFNSNSPSTTACSSIWLFVTLRAFPETIVSFPLRVITAARPHGPGLPSELPSVCITTLMQNFIT